MRIEIKKIHIESDIVNNAPTLILTDAKGVEWALTHHSISYDGGGTMRLDKKKDSWYFDPKNKAK